MARGKELRSCSLDTLNDMWLGQDRLTKAGACVVQQGRLLDAFRQTLERVNANRRPIMCWPVSPYGLARQRDVTAASVPTPSSLLRVPSAPTLSERERASRDSITAGIAGRLHTAEIAQGF